MFFARVTYLFLLVVIISEVEQNGARFKEGGCWSSGTILQGGNPSIGIDFQEPIFLILNHDGQTRTFCSFFWKDNDLTSYFNPNSSRRMEILYPFGVELNVRRSID
jgi:hypothetical protein